MYLLKNRYVKFSSFFILKIIRKIELKNLGLLTNTTFINYAS